MCVCVCVCEPTLPLQVEVAVSQGRPVSRQCGPRVFGETSPRFVEANPATKLPLYTEAGCACVWDWGIVVCDVGCSA